MAATLLPRRPNGGVNTARRAETAASTRKFAPLVREPRAPEVEEVGFFMQRTAVCSVNLFYSSLFYHSCSTYSL